MSGSRVRSWELSREDGDHIQPDLLTLDVAAVGRELDDVKDAELQGSAAASRPKGRPKLRPLPSSIRRP